ncbi:YlmC/YmxH family sporulation protein [Anaerosalibacter massiliensis]|uniref:YlmC/YmxH family sporulation protein n=1 Tax=Anaerosalibacter massiliensis TaxID=1347392 RepID=A0A9X2MG18_9FIRM|nr:YlmC/YmxH family sporulation protein [Anaerosalibacter massiliensis]MCR2042878.1 YlmC/YmxH family sporulation protein [Anaerosalibacter massiliensis]
MIKISELREKEIINIRDGSRLGYIDDVKVDLDKGEVTGIIIPGPGKVFSLFGKNQDVVINWNDIIKIGIDTILIDFKEAE